MIGSMELLVILAVILILFGGKKLPEFAKNLGKGIHEFKKACNGHADEDNCCSHDKELDISCKPLTRQQEEKDK